MADLVVRSRTADAQGWRWRIGYRGIEVAAWNDMDGVAVVADIGPWDEWVGLAGHPPDPGADEALEWVIEVLSGWLSTPEHAARIEDRVKTRDQPAAE
jgi:hypothetical protein